jgi:hypothetical protein
MTRDDVMEWEFFVLNPLIANGDSATTALDKDAL